jgi:Ca-activated chloride channel homolog
MRDARVQGIVLLMATATVTALAMVAAGQVNPAAIGHHRALAANIIVPQSRSAAVANRASAVRVTKVDVGVVVTEQVATTTMDIALRNPTGRRQEAEMILPVPAGATVRSFTFSGAAAEPTARLLPKAEAKSTYDAIVAKVRDPALLEFVGYNLIRTSVFPVEARGKQKVRLTYEHLLPADGPRVDYTLPRTEAVNYTVPWSVSVRIKSKRPIVSVYSPSHELDVKRVSPNIVSARIAASATTEPGAFRLSYLLERDGVTASLLAYPNASGDGGYFLLLAGLPPKLRENGAAPGIKREVILVIDRSGSMRGEKLDQVREAALQIIAGLDTGETFNILTYNEQVSLFASQPQARSKETAAAAQKYLEGIRASGGTNIHDALLEALRQKPTEGFLPIVLFLTDGLPTVGQTNEAAITRLATKANPHKRRIFTFGVGVDVNTPLLEKIAVETRATPTFVLPKEDVEVKVAQTFRRLVGPVLADCELRVAGEAVAAASRVSDLLPSKLPDLFEGDQLVLLGRYTGTKPLAFGLKGNFLGRRRTFNFTLSVDKATTRNAFVPRLWASRRIAVLTDAIRDMGADPRAIGRPAVAASDPRLKELVNEIVRLSTEYGILTEYTAFLAREGTDLSDHDNVLAEATGNFNRRAVATRSGTASVNQSLNNSFQRVQTYGNRRNDFWDQHMNRVQITSVQQINDQTFYRRGNRWVDSRVADKTGGAEPRTVIEFGSEAFRQLVSRLAREGRQGSISLDGEIVLVVDGKPVLIKPAAAVK